MFLINVKTACISVYFHFLFQKDLQLYVCKMAAVTHNNWVYPEDHFASNEQSLKFNICEKIGNWNFSQCEWKRGCLIADDVLRIILNDLRNQARLHFEGLEIQSDFVQQASARQE